MLLLLTLIATGAAAQVRGDGKIAGKVVDNDSGQPLENVQVKGTLAGQTQAVTAKSNKKGEFNLSGIGSGEWTLEFTKDGFDPQGGKLTVDQGKSPDITVKLVKHVDKPDPGVELNAKAQEGMTLLQGQKYAEARKVFEDLLAKYPDVHQINAYIAQTYAGENNLPKAIEFMKTASDKDPDNAEMRLVLADLMMEGGDKAAALDMMKTIDVTKIKNPLPLINGSISLINSNKPDEALDILNKVATQFPTQAETFYYRGRAYVAAKKYPEAKADLEKFVGMAAPDARELPDAKKLLDQLKDAK
jgi:predicted Zn-dependent protease